MRNNEKNVWIAVLLVCFLCVGCAKEEERWSGAGIHFVVIMPFDTSILKKSWFANEIAYNSYQ